MVKTWLRPLERKHAHSHTRPPVALSLLPVQLTSISVSLSLTQQGGSEGGGRVASWSPWQPHTPSSPETCCHGDLIPFHRHTSRWSSLDRKKRVIPEQLSRGAAGRRDSRTPAGTRIRGWAGPARWQNRGSNTGALLGNSSSMPVQQISVAPAREMSSHGKGAAYSKDRAEVSVEALCHSFEMWWFLRQIFNLVTLNVYLVKQLRF